VAPSFIDQENPFRRKELILFPLDERCSPFFRRKIPGRDFSTLKTGGGHTPEDPQGRNSSFSKTTEDPFFFFCNGPKLPEKVSEEEAVLSPGRRRRAAPPADFGPPVRRQKPFKIPLSHSTGELRKDQPKRLRNTEKGLHFLNFPKIGPLFFSPGERIQRKTPFAPLGTSLFPSVSKESPSRKWIPVLPPFRSLKVTSRRPQERLFHLSFGGASFSRVRIAFSRDVL